VIGRGVKVDKTERRIVGVAPPDFRFPPFQPGDLILPSPMPLQAPAARKSSWTFAVARLKSSATTAQASANLAAISQQMERQYPSSNAGSEYFAVPLRDALVGNTKTTLVLMLAAVGVVLLIACANVANLMLARSIARRREMAVRTALGARWGRLAAQVLTESLVLAVVAGAAGIVVANWAVRAVVRLVPRDVKAPGLSDVHMGASSVAFALGVSVLTALGFGLLSAFALRGGRAVDSLAGAARVSSGRSSRRIASGLVVSEVALAVVLLIGAGLIVKSFKRLLSVDPGFRTDHLLTASILLPGDQYRGAESKRLFFERAADSLRSLPDFREAGVAVVTPLTGNNWTVGFERADQPVGANERPPEVGWQLASGGYFRTLHIPLLKGRLFDSHDRPDGKQVVIVSEAIQKRFFPHDDPIGREIKLGKSKAEIVGVVGNIRRAGLRDDPRADLYFAFENSPSNQITLFVRTTLPPLQALPSLQSALRSIEPNIAILETHTMDEIVSASVQDTDLALWLLGIFSTIALALAAVGIYGVTSYVVRQRTRDIGTRIALGATKRDILWLVMRQGAGIALLGSAIGVGAGAAAARLLRSMVFDVSLYDPATLAISTAILVATTLAACYFPARRAARVDPAVALADPG